MYFMYMFYVWQVFFSPRTPLQRAIVPLPFVIAWRRAGKLASKGGKGCARPPHTRQLRQHLVVVGGENEVRPAVLGKLSAL
ncbi:MAG: hypothetical protein ACTS6J_22815 [Burkholderiales bacterium]